MSPLNYRAYSTEEFRDGYDRIDWGADGAGGQANPPASPRPCSCLMCRAAAGDQDAIERLRRKPAGD